MSVYSINYDLNSPGQNYDDLYEEIKQQGAWWHYLESMWLVDTSKSTSTIRDNLSPHLDNNDEILVTKLSGSWSSWGLSDNAEDWLHDHL